MDIVHLHETTIVDRETGLLVHGSPTQICRWWRMAGPGPPAGQGSNSGDFTHSLRHGRVIPAVVSIVLAGVRR